MYSVEECYRLCGLPHMVGYHATPFGDGRQGTAGRGAESIRMLYEAIHYSRFRRNQSTMRSFMSSV